MIMVMTASAFIIGSVIDHIIRTCDGTSRASRLAVSAPCAVIAYKSDDVINDFEPVTKTRIDTSLTANTFFFIYFRNVHCSFLT